jgi:hypothetical protein
VWHIHSGAGQHAGRVGGLCLKITDINVNVNGGRIACLSMARLTSGRLSHFNTRTNKNAMIQGHRGHNRRFFILLSDWTWWAWTVTAILLTIGLCGYPNAFVAAMVVTACQGIVMMIREKSLSAFPVQIRVAYLVLLGISFVPRMRWLFWVPVVGTFALVIFGYCLMARVLSLLPWNRQGVVSADLLWRTFVSRPDLSRLAENRSTVGCAGGLCTIDAQVVRRKTTEGGHA